MLPLVVSALITLASNSLASVLPPDERHIYNRDISSLTEQDVDTLDLYAEYSASAPCNVLTPVGEPVTCYQNCDRVEADGAIILGTFLGEITEFAAYLAVVESRQQIIFVGRGSATKQNWCTNFNFTLIPSDLVDGGLVHGGFQTAWYDIANQVVSTLLGALNKYPDYKIVITGGSLGGAVATLAAANLRALGHPADLYTYGAPKIGNDILSDFISNQEGTFYRVTHARDVVPRLPFTDGFPNYKQLSPEYWLTGEPADPNHWPIEDIKICEGNSNRGCIDNPLNGWDWTFEDHQNYLGSLQCWKSPESGPIGFEIPDDVKEYIQSIAVAAPIAGSVTGPIPVPFVCNS